MTSRTNLMIDFMNFLETPEGCEQLREIFNEAVDELLKENPDWTREEIVARFKLNN